MTIAFRGAYARPINSLLLGAGAGALVSTLHSGTALPMSAPLPFVALPRCSVCNSWCYVRWQQRWRRSDRAEFSTQLFCDLLTIS